MAPTPCPTGNIEGVGGTMDLGVGKKSFFIQPFSDRRPGLAGCPICYLEAHLISTPLCWVPDPPGGYRRLPDPEARTHLWKNK